MSFFSSRRGRSPIKNLFSETATSFSWRLSVFDKSRHLLAFPLSRFFKGQNSVNVFQRAFVINFQLGQAWLKTNAWIFFRLMYSFACMICELVLFNLVDNTCMICVFVLFDIFDNASRSCPFPFFLCVFRWSICRTPQRVFVVNFRPGQAGTEDDHMDLLSMTVSFLVANGNTTNDEARYSMMFPLSAV